ncbi:MAG TPA: hypothetical protein VGD72_09150 [Mycobacteriales bacterium]
MRLSESSRLDRALREYVAGGWPVLTPDGAADAHGIAVVTGSVVDAWDVPTAIGAQGMRILERMRGPWPAVSHTGDGRWLFFTQPYTEPVPVIEAHGSRVRHVGAGQTALLPPSRRSTSRPDRWVWVPRFDRMPAAHQTLAALVTAASRLHTWEVRDEPTTGGGPRRS